MRPVEPHKLGDRRQTNPALVVFELGGKDGATVLKRLADAGVSGFILADITPDESEALEAEAPADWKSVFSGYTGYAREHRDVIARFGRFPGRNAALGRTALHALASERRAITTESGTPMRAATCGIRA